VQTPGNTSPFLLLISNFFGPEFSGLVVAYVIDEKFWLPIMN